MRIKACCKGSSCTSGKSGTWTRIDLTFKNIFCLATQWREHKENDAHQSDKQCNPRRGRGGMRIT